MNFKFFDVVIEDPFKSLKIAFLIITDLSFLLTLLSPIESNNLFSNITELL